MGAAFFIGLVGGLHCMGMCGGIVAALSMGHEGQRGSNAIPWPGVCLYHLGRVFTYCFLGLCFGLIGGMVTDHGSVLKAQKVLSVIAGLGMIYFAVQTGGWISERFGPLAFIKLPTSFLQKAAKGDSLPSWLLVGLINGLLPCGLVYASLSLALNSASLIKGALLMFVFGLGTVPSLLGVSAIMAFLKPSLRGTLLKAAAILLAGFGVFLVFRGVLMSEGGFMH